MTTAAAATRATPAGRLPGLGVFARLVGPAALTAAGMIGAGAVATRLLAGAWFGFDLLWVAIYVIPMVIVTLDSASRVAAVHAGRGMLEMVRADIGVWLAWVIFLAAFAVNVIVNMSQGSAMVEGAYGAFGALPPAHPDGTIAAVTIALAAVSVLLGVFGGYKRIERIMTALLLLILFSFIVVAVKGLFDWYTWGPLLRGLVPHVPADIPVVGDVRTRSGYTQMIAIAGQALPPTVFLTYGYLSSNAGYTAQDVRRAFWKTVQNLGVIWGLFSVVVIVAGTTALHDVYTGSGISYLGVTHFSQIESIPVAGQVLGPAFPGALGFLAPRFFSAGLFAAGFTTLISVALTMSYLCMDIARRDWHFTRENRTFQAVFGAWIAVPALLAPFWSLPALLKAIIAMVGNLLLAPVAVAVIFYFVNQRRMGALRANTGRNIVLAVTLAFALGLAMTGVVRFFQ